MIEQKIEVKWRRKLYNISGSRGVVIPMDFFRQTKDKAIKYVDFVPIDRDTLEIHLIRDDQDE